MLIGCVHPHLLLQDRLQSQRRVGRVDELGDHHGKVPEGVGALCHLAARATEGGGFLENPKQLRLSDRADRYRMGQTRSLTVLVMIVRQDRVFGCEQGTGRSTVQQLHDVLLD